MHGDNGEAFIATLYNILFAPDFCVWLFYIILLMNSGHTCFFHKEFCAVFFSDNKHNVVPLTHTTQGKHVFLVKTKEKSKLKKLKSQEEKFFITIA